MAERDAPRLDILDRLAATIASRRNADPSSSYVAALLAKGDDAILLRVEQVGGIACHTGREHCFFQRLEGDRWVGVEPVVKDPQAIYGHD